MQILIITISIIIITIKNNNAMRLKLNPQNGIHELSFAFIHFRSRSFAIFHFSPVSFT